MSSDNPFGKACIKGFAISLAAWASCTSFAAAEDSHRRDYDAALNIALQSEPRIVEEMTRILSGEVAHYDFLQFEHIELIRHSQALAFPPADVTTTTKTNIEKEAKTLVDTAQDLEWVIADYLRAIAQVRNATSNTLDIIATAEANSSATKSLQLSKLNEAMTNMTTPEKAQQWTKLDSLFGQVLAQNSDTQLQAELTFQRQQLGTNLPKVEALIQQVKDSPIDVIATRLNELNKT